MTNGVGGSANDPDVTFSEDTYNAFEGPIGIEDTLRTSAFGRNRS